MPHLLYALYQLLGSIKFATGLTHLNIFYTFCFLTAVAMKIDYFWLILTLCFVSVHYREVTSALPTGDVSSCLLLGTFSKENIYKRPCTYPMLPAGIQKIDLKDWRFTFSDRFQVTPTVPPPEQSTKGKKPSLTRQGCQCTNITAQHLVLATSEPYPPLGSRFASCLKAFSNGNVLLIMQSEHFPHN